MSQQHSGVDHFVPDSEMSGSTTFSTVADPFGSSIRSLREARGWTVSDVSARLKFGVRQIEALEAGRWDELPKGPSLRGLIRNYARLLDVSAETLMSALPEHLQHHQAPVGNLAPVGALPSHATLPRWSGESRRRRWPMVVLVLFLLCALALAAYLVFAWWLPRNADSGPSTISGFPLVDGSESAMVSGPVTPVPPAAGGDIPQSPPAAVPSSGGAASPSGNAANISLPPAAPADAGQASQPAAQGDAPVAAAASQPALVAGASGNPVAGSPAAGSPAAGAPADPAAPAPSVVANQLQFTVTAASWVEVRDASGSVVMSSTLQPGTEQQLEVSPPARVVIGNAKGVTLDWQGQTVDLGPHQRGNVARLTLE